MTLIDKVENALKWKKSASITAKRLNISETQFLKLKEEILKGKPELIQNVNLDKGESTISGIFKEEPKTPDEIIKLLNIDTTKWKLSQYWNKQVSNGWKVSALVTKLKEDEKSFLDIIKNWNPKKYKIKDPDINKLSTNKVVVCGVMSLQDIHFGKQNNENIDQDFKHSVEDLLTRASLSHFIDKLYFVVGGDLLNMDTFDGTTTKGTTLDNCMKATDAYQQAFDAMLWAIEYAKGFSNKLVIVYMPGNHDRLSSFHLVHALSKCIKNDNIEWDINYEERKVHVYGNNFNAFEHGDVSSKNTPLVYATEYPILWGLTKHRTLYTGHYHKDEKIEYVTNSETVGFVHKTLPSLAKSDYWHYHNKFVGNKRAAKLELQHSLFGNICELRSLPI